MTPISLAKLRLRLPVGQRFTAEYIGPNAKAGLPEKRFTQRTVVSQSSYQMVSVRDSDDQKVYCTWSNVKAEVEESGSIVLTMGEQGDRSKEHFLRITI